MVFFKHHAFAVQVEIGDVKSSSPLRPIQAAEKKLADAHQGITAQEADPAQKAAGGFDKQTWVENRMQFEGQGETTKAKLEAEFEKFDTDGDGTMEETEFLDLMRDRAANGGNMNIGDYTDGTQEKSDLSAGELKALTSGVKPKSEATLKQQQALNQQMQDIDAAAARPDATPAQKQQKADLDKLRTEHPECFKDGKLAEDGREGPLTRRVDAAMKQITRPNAQPLAPCVEKTVPTQAAIDAAKGQKPAAGAETDAMIMSSAPADLQQLPVAEQRALLEKATSKPAREKLGQALLESNPQAFDQAVIGQLGNESLERVVANADQQALNELGRVNKAAALEAIDTLDDAWSWRTDAGEVAGMKKLADGLLANAKTPAEARALGTEIGGASGNGELRTFVASRLPAAPQPQPVLQGKRPGME